MIEIGVRHRRVLALDIHAPDLAGIRGMDDLDHGQPGLLGERRLPKLLEFGVDRRALHVGIVRVEHRDQAGIGGALHVVLAAQRMKPGAGPADLAAYQRQRNEAARIVGAVHVLGNAHAPEDHGPLGAAEGAGDLADGLWRDAGDRGHRLGAVGGEMLLQPLEILGIGLEVLHVVEALFDDHMHDAVEQGHVARRLELEHEAGVFAHRLPARIDDDELGAALRRLFEEGGGHRVVLGRIGADDHDHVGMLDLVEGRGHRAGADAVDQRRHRGGVTKPACSDRHCWCGSGCGSASGTDRPLRWCIWPSRSRRWPRRHGSRRPGRGPRRQSPAPRPSSLHGNGCRDRRDRHSRLWRGRACGSTASSAAADWSHSRSRSGL